MAHQFTGPQNFKPRRGPTGCLIYVSLSTQTGCAAGLGAALFLTHPILVTGSPHFEATSPRSGLRIFHLPTFLCVFSSN